MANDRLLIDYLPIITREYREMQEIMNAEQSEVDALWVAAEGMLDDQFIIDAGVNGISRWEKMLRISPKATETLEERRFRILTRLNQELPYTMTRLDEALSALCGADGYSINLTAAEYKIEVKVALVSKNNYHEVQKTLAKMIPANMMQYVTVMYRTNAEVAAYTHAQLAAYTHDHIRNEVFN